VKDRLFENVQLHCALDRRGFIRTEGVGLAGLAALAVLGPHQAHASRGARLQISSVKCISTTSATDAGTQVLFRILGAAAAMAATVATGGVAAIVTASALTSAATAAVSAAALTTNIPGSDSQLFIRVQDRSRQLWFADLWNDEGGRDIGSQGALATNVVVDIDFGPDVYIELFDCDASSNSDSAGSIFIENRPLPYSNTVTIADPDEGSMYLVDVRIGPL
jgi:hypothetical protein